MSFAEKILKKFGWKEGEGIGKHNDGIKKPLKASLKFDNDGLGLDKAAEFNNHWWERVFNEAASNVQVGKEGDKVSVNVKNKESVEITTKEYSVRKLNKNKRDSYDNFLLSATLTKTGDEVSNPDKIKVEDINVVPHRHLTDEELFAACGGRTAHKGARHGLNLSGKLARIEQQENELLLKMKTQIFEEPSQSWAVVKSKKKKTNEVPKEYSITDDESKINDILYTADYCIKSKKKRKEKKKTEEELSACLQSISMENEKEGERLLGISHNSKAIKKLQKSKKIKNPDKWRAYRNINNEKEAPENNIEEENIRNGSICFIDEKTEDPDVKTKKKKSKKCKHGIDKEAKEAHKMAKNLKKKLQHVTQDLERAALLIA